MTQPILEVRDLKISITEKPDIQIVKGIDLTIRPGEIHALMGPNGSGKSTLASTIAGSPTYKVDSGSILFRGEDVTAATADARARMGIFLSFQYPTPIPGVTMVNLMRESLKARRGAEVPAREFLAELRATLAKLKMSEDMARRYVNDGFSGGEKKRAEILQMGLLKPDLAILDETDSGLDVDALRTVSEGVNALRTSDMGVLIITHYERILNYIEPDFVHILVGGRIVTSGGFDLAKRVEHEGYDPILKELGIASAETPVAEGGRSMTTTDARSTVGEYKWGFHDDEKPLFMAEKGLTEDVIRGMSKMKDEPAWMLEYRLDAFEQFKKLSDPKWAGSAELLASLDFADIHYYVRATDKDSSKWEDVPQYIKDTFDKLGIPEAEKQFLAGAGAQYDSEVVYHNIREDLEKLGVIFLGMDQGLREYEDIVREYFGTIVPSGDNRFAALNSAVWSGGSFIYVPKGVKVDVPLQAYFRINTENMGQFERTLIIADEGSQIHYVEGCTAPTYSTDSLHSAVVEIIVKKGARVRYTTIQNWSNNVFNLVTKRAYAYEDAIMEWVDGNLGSKLTMKYPSVYLMGERAHGEILSLAFAGDGQHQDAGGKIVHVAPNTTSAIISKSVSRGSGRTSYRGLLKVHEGAENSSSTVRCDALLLDTLSRSDTYPTMEIDEERVNIGHEASVSKLGVDQLFYLMSRGIKEEEAAKMVVNGFVEPIVKELPMEYAIELNRLIELQMEGSVG